MHRHSRHCNSSKTITGLDISCFFFFKPKTENVLMEEDAATKQWSKHEDMRDYIMEKEQN